MWSGSRLLATTSGQVNSVVPENRMTSKTAMAAVHGHTTLFQLCPNGPNIVRMKMCMATAATSESRRQRLVSSPMPNATCTKGASAPNIGTSFPIERKQRGDRLHQPGKVGEHEIRIELLQAGKDVGERHDQPAEIERSLLAGLSVERDERDDRHQQTVLKNPGLPARLILETEHQHDGEEGGDEPSWPSREQRRGRQREQRAIEHDRGMAFDFGRRRDNRHERKGAWTDPERR